MLLTIFKHMIRSEALNKEVSLMENHRPDSNIRFQFLLGIKAALQPHIDAINDIRNWTVSNEERNQKTVNSIFPFIQREFANFEGLFGDVATRFQDAFRRLDLAHENLEDGMARIEDANGMMWESVASKLSSISGSLDDVKKVSDTVVILGHLLIKVPTSFTPSRRKS